MQIKTITYQKVKNLSSESERLEMSAELHENDDPVSIALELRIMVNNLFKMPIEVEPEAYEDLESWSS